MGELPKMHGPIVKNSMNGITPKSINMIMDHPMQGVVRKKIPHPIRPVTVIVDSISPRSSVLLCKVRSKSIKIITFWSQMVVHHIQIDSYTFVMTGIYQMFESFRSSIGMLHRIRIDAIVAPVPISRKLRYWHQFDSVDTKRQQIIQIR